MGWIWKVGADQFSHIRFTRHLSANKDLGKPRLVWARPSHLYLILPRCQYSELAWHSPLKTTFISNTKWSRVVKWSLIFLIVDRSVSCWFSVCVLYFASLICSQLTPVAFTSIEGRGQGYPESQVLCVTQTPGFLHSVEMPVLVTDMDSSPHGCFTLSPFNNPEGKPRTPEVWLSGHIKHAKERVTNRVPCHSGV